MVVEQKFDPCTEIDNPKWPQLYAAFETNPIEAFKHYPPPQSVIPIHIRISTKTPLPSPHQLVLVLVLTCTEEDIEKTLTIIDVTKDLGQIERLVPWLIISHLVHQSTFPARIASYLSIENSNFTMKSSFQKHNFNVKCVYTEVVLSIWFGKPCSLYKIVLNFNHSCEFGLKIH